MLILSRKAGEKIMIGDNIELTVVSIQGDQVKIGISAPKDIDIFRKELVDQIVTLNTEAKAPVLNLQELKKISKKD